MAGSFSSGFSNGFDIGTPAAGGLFRSLFSLDGLGGVGKVALNPTLSAVLFYILFF